MRMSRFHHAESLLSTMVEADTVTHKDDRVRRCVLAAPHDYNRFEEDRACHRGDMKSGAAARRDAGGGTNPGSMGGRFAVFLVSAESSSS